MKYYVNLLFQYLMRKKYLHKTVGVLAFSYLVFELATPQLPKELIPDYVKFQQDYGEFPAMFLGYFIDKQASGANTITVISLLAILIYCLYVELKIHSVNSGNKNNFFGLFQNINQTFNGQ